MSGDDLSDEQLMLMFRYGNRAAFDLLFEKYRTPVFNFARRMLGGREAAEDVCQETFLRVVGAAGGWRPEARFRTWLYTIARNCCFNALRDAPAAAAALSADAAGREHGPRERAVASETAERVEQAIGRLPEPLREAFLMRFRHGLSYAEIAQVTEQPLGTVKTHIHRARTRLAHELKDEL